MKKYKCVMDDGVRIDVPAKSAADAQQIALEKHLGHRVMQCYLGEIYEDRKKFYKGYTNFEVMPHDPLPKNWEKEKRPRSKDTPVEMFDDKAIQEHSAIAREKFNYDQL